MGLSAVNMDISFAVPGKLSLHLNCVLKGMIHT